MTDKPSDQNSLTAADTIFANTQDFIDIVNKNSEHNLDWFFDVYIFSAALPILDVARTENEVTFDQDVHFQLNNDLKMLKPGHYQFGVRASHIGLVPHSDDDLELPVKVDLAELSGSETFLHVRNPHFELVLHLSGVHEYEVDQEIKIYFPTHKLYAFDTQGSLVHSPARLVEA